MKILISAFSNLYTDQRIEKICQTLHNRDYSIRLIGNNWGCDKPICRPYSYHRILLKSKILRWAYVEFNWKLYYELLKYADSSTILYANDLDTLLPNYLISKKKNIPLIYDSHEIFTEMPSINGRWSQTIWRILEHCIIHRLKYMITASDSYANWFKNHYHIEKPVVIQNFPRQIDFTYINKKTSKKIILYQGAINPSRGLDKIIPIMKRFDDAELWIVGDGPKRNDYIELTQELNLCDRILFMGSLSPCQLKQTTPMADVGLSIEENNGLSYLYSLPNKISDYIQARVPIITSNFPEMRRIVNKYNVGEIIDNHSEEELFLKISKVLQNGKEYYLKALQSASQELIWEKEEIKLLQFLEKIEYNIRS